MDLDEVPTSESSTRLFPVISSSTLDGFLSQSPMHDACGIVLPLLDLKASRIVDIVSKGADGGAAALQAVEQQKKIKLNCSQTERLHTERLHTVDEHTATLVGKKQVDSDINNRVAEVVGPRTAWQQRDEDNRYAIILSSHVRPHSDGAVGSGPLAEKGTRSGAELELMKEELEEIRAQKQTLQGLVGRLGKELKAAAAYVAKARHVEKEYGSIRNECQVAKDQFEAVSKENAQLLLRHSVEREALHSQLEAYRAELGKVRKEVTSLQEEMREHDSRAQKARSAKHQIIERAKADKQLLLNEIKDLRAQVSVACSERDDVARVLEEDRQATGVQVEALARKVAQSEAANSAAKIKVEELEHFKVESNELEEALELSQVNAAALSSQLTNAQQEAALLKLENDTTLTGAKDRIANLEEELAQLAQAAKDLTAAKDAAQKELEVITSEAEIKKERHTVEVHEARQQAEALRSALDVAQSDATVLRQRVEELEKTVNSLQISTPLHTQKLENAEKARSHLEERLLAEIKARADSETREVASTHKAASLQAELESVHAKRASEKREQMQQRCVSYKVGPENVQRPRTVPSQDTRLDAGLLEPRPPTAPANYNGARRPSRSAGVSRVASISPGKSRSGTLPSSKSMVHINRILEMLGLREDGESEDVAGTDAGPVPASAEPNPVLHAIQQLTDTVDSNLQQRPPSRRASVVASGRTSVCSESVEHFVEQLSHAVCSRLENLSSPSPPFSSSPLLSVTQEPPRQVPSRPASSSSVRPESVDLALSRLIESVDAQFQLSSPPKSTVSPHSSRPASAVSRHSPRHSPHPPVTSCRQSPHTSRPTSAHVRPRSVMSFIDHMVESIDERLSSSTPLPATIIHPPHSQIVRQESIVQAIGELARAVDLELQRLHTNAVIPMCTEEMPAVVQHEPAPDPVRLRSADHTVQHSKANAFVPKTNEEVQVVRPESVDLALHNLLVAVVTELQKATLEEPIPTLVDKSSLSFSRPTTASSPLPILVRPESVAYAIESLLHTVDDELNAHAHIHTAHDPLSGPASPGQEVLATHSPVAQRPESVAAALDQLVDEVEEQARAWATLPDSLSQLPSSSQRSWSPSRANTARPSSPYVRPESMASAIGQLMEAIDAQFQNTVVEQRSCEPSLCGISQVRTVRSDSVVCLIEQLTEAVLQQLERDERCAEPVSSSDSDQRPTDSDNGLEPEAEPQSLSEPLSDVLPGPSTEIVDDTLMLVQEANRAQDVRVYRGERPESVVALLLDGMADKVEQAMHWGSLMQQEEMTPEAVLRKAIQVLSIAPEYEIHRLHEALMEVMGDREAGVVLRKATELLPRAEQDDVTALYEGLVQVMGDRVAEQVASLVEELQGARAKGVELEQDLEDAKGKEGELQARIRGMEEEVARIGEELQAEKEQGEEMRALYEAVKTDAMQGMEQRWEERQAKMEAARQADRAMWDEEKARLEGVAAELRRTNDEAEEKAKRAEQELQTELEKGHEFLLATCKEHLVESKCRNEALTSAMKQMETTATDAAKRFGKLEGELRVQVAAVQEERKAALLERNRMELEVHRMELELRSIKEMGVERQLAEAQAQAEDAQKRSESLKHAMHALEESLSEINLRWSTVEMELRGQLTCVQDERRLIKMERDGLQAEVRRLGALASSGEEDRRALHRNIDDTAVRLSEMTARAESLAASLKEANGRITEDHGRFGEMEEMLRKRARDAEDREGVATQQRNLLAQQAVRLQSEVDSLTVERDKLVGASLELELLRQNLTETQVRKDRSDKLEAHVRGLEKELVVAHGEKTEVEAEHVKQMGEMVSAADEACRKIHRLEEQLRGMEEECQRAAKAKEEVVCAEEATAHAKARVAELEASVLELEGRVESWTKEAADKEAAVQELQVSLQEAAGVQERLALEVRGLEERAELVAKDLALAEEEAAEGARQAHLAIELADELSRSRAETKSQALILGHQINELETRVASAKRDAQVANNTLVTARADREVAQREAQRLQEQLGSTEKRLQEQLTGLEQGRAQLEEQLRIVVAERDELNKKVSNMQVEADVATRECSDEKDKAKEVRVRLEEAQSMVAAQAQDIRSLRDEAADKTTLLEVLSVELRDTQERLRMAEADKSHIAFQKDTSEEQLHTLRQAFLNEMGGLQESLKAAQQDKEQSISGLRRELEQRANKAQAEANSMREEVGRVREEGQELRKNLAQMAGRCAELGVHIDALETRLIEVTSDKESADVNSRLSTEVLNTKVAELELEVQRSKDQVTQALHQLDGERALCHRTVGEKQRQVERIEEEMRELAEGRVWLLAEKETLTAELSRSRADAVRMEHERDEAQNQIRLSQDMTSLEAQRSMESALKARAEVDALQRQLTAVQQQVETARAGVGVQMASQQAVWDRERGVLTDKVLRLEEQVQSFSSSAFAAQRQVEQLQADVTRARKDAETRVEEMRSAKESFVKENANLRTVYEREIHSLQEKLARTSTVTLRPAETVNANVSPFDKSLIRQDDWGHTQEARDRVDSGGVARSISSAGSSRRSTPTPTLGEDYVDPDLLALEKMAHALGLAGVDDAFSFVTSPNSQTIYS